MTPREQVSRAVLDALDAATAARDAAWAAIDAGNRLGVPVPGYGELLQLWRTCAAVADDHCRARVLATAELGPDTKGTVR